MTVWVAADFHFSLGFWGAHRSEVLSDWLEEILANFALIPLEVNLHEKENLIKSNKYSESS